MCVCVSYFFKFLFKNQLADLLDMKIIQNSPRIHDDYFDDGCNCFVSFFFLHSSINKKHNHHRHSENCLFVFLNFQTRKPSLFISQFQKKKICSLSHTAFVVVVVSIIGLDFIHSSIFCSLTLSISFYPMMIFFCFHKFKLRITLFFIVTLFFDWPFIFSLSLSIFMRLFI